MLKQRLQCNAETTESSMSCGFFVVFLTAQRAKLAILGRFRSSRMSALSGFFCFYVMSSSSFKFWAQVTPKWSNSKRASTTWNARNAHFSKRKRSSGARQIMKNHKRSSTFRRLQLSGNGGNLATWSENMRKRKKQHRTASGKKATHPWHPRIPEMKWKGGALELFPSFRRRWGRHRNRKVCILCVKAWQNPHLPRCVFALRRETIRTFRGALSLL